MVKTCKSLQDILHDGINSQGKRYDQGSEGKQRMLEEEKHRREAATATHEERHGPIFKEVQVKNSSARRLRHKEIQRAEAWLDELCGFNWFQSVLNLNLWMQHKQTQSASWAPCWALVRIYMPHAISALNMWALKETRGRRTGLLLHNLWLTLVECEGIPALVTLIDVPTQCWII